MSSEPGVKERKSNGWLQWAGEVPRKADSRDRVMRDEMSSCCH